MEEHLTTYQISKYLKELGFDKPCFGYYNTDGELIWFAGNIGVAHWNLKDIEDISAPTWGQAIDFLLQEIKTNLNYGYAYTVFHDGVYKLKRCNGIDLDFDDKEEFVVYLINLLK